MTLRAAWQSSLDLFCVVVPMSLAAVAGLGPWDVHHIPRREVLLLILYALFWNLWREIKKGLQLTTELLKKKNNLWLLWCSSICPQPKSETGTVRKKRWICVCGHLKVRSNCLLPQRFLWRGESAFFMWSAFWSYAREECSKQDAPSHVYHLPFILLMTTEPSKKKKNREIIWLFENVVWTLPYR